MLQRAVERTPDESVFLRERVQQQTAKQIEDAQGRGQQCFAEQTTQVPEIWRRKISQRTRDQILDVPMLLMKEHSVEVPGSVSEEKNLAAYQRADSGL